MNSEIRRVENRAGYFIALAVLTLNTLAVFFGKTASIFAVKHPRLGILGAYALNPFYVCGLGTLVLGALIWPFALKRLELSKAYSVLSLQYVSALGISALCFGERITTYNIVGSLLVTVGVKLMVTGKNQ